MSSRRRELPLSVDAPRVTIGRSSQADIALTSDEEASRLHAVVERLGGQWTIIDDGLSSNGTFVNGKRLIGRHRLIPGDSIRVGSTQLTYVDYGRPTSARTSVSDVLPTRRALTDAQMAVLVALCRPYGHRAPFASPASNKQIAAELFLSAETVKTHLRVLFDKFGVGDLPQNQKRARLAERAMQGGIVTDHDL
ncbi:FHA domain-containing protein [Rhodococcus sp. NPDC058521]|uniref:FHA domain-containing protein n=1 Tax=Rhodococcus sp. NPDC058521 TaxID=3346536 RepID=UPI0036496B99